MSAPSRASVRYAARWRWLGALALAPVLVAAEAAVAAPRPVPAVVGELAGVTAITWRGTAGFRLRVPRQVMLPESGGTRLFVSGGTYAVVRMTADGLCDPGLPRYCATRNLTYTRDLARTVFPNARPGRDHDAFMGSPPSLERRTFDLYLFTDGVATLELRPSGLRGQRAYEARGRITGGVARLATSCPTAGCSSAGGYAGGRYMFGGASRDVGALGYVESFAYSGDTVVYPHPSLPVPVVQPHPVHVCVYPTPFAPKASPAAEAHPFGCDPPGSSPDTTENATHETVNELVWSQPASGVLKRIWNPASRGTGYAGYRAGYLTDEPTRSITAGYGVWFTYGVR